MLPGRIAMFTTHKYEFLRQGRSNVTRVRYLTCIFADQAVLCYLREFEGEVTDTATGTLAP